MVDPGMPVFKPKKGSSNIFMTVGLQGSGKTTTCCKVCVAYSCINLNATNFLPRLHHIIREKVGRWVLFVLILLEPVHLIN